MRSKIDLSNALQFLTLLSVVIGIGLVIVELRQTHDLAIADLIAQQFLYGGSFDGSLVGENAAQAIAKSCIDPESLTPEELVVLDYYHFHILDLVMMLAITTNAAGEDPTDLKVEQYAKARFMDLFATEIGRSWWLRNRELFGPEMAEYGSRVLATMTGEPSCRKTFDGYLSKPVDAK